MDFMRRRLGWVLGAPVVLAPALVQAANVALEAPVNAVARQPGESFEVIQGLLEERGHTVTIVAGDEIDTLDEIQQFSTIVLSASGYQDGQDVAVFDAVIEDYVNQGGGLVITGWVYYYNGVAQAPGLNAVAPFEPSTNYLQGGLVEMIPGHEIVDGLADWNNPSFDAYSGALKDGAIAISENAGTIDGGVWQVGGGRVASLGPLFMAEYEVYATQALHDGSIPDATEMFMRAIEWTALEDAPEGCHDGDLDPGEECDDGNYANNDACVHPCVVASCGDGYTWAGMEPCDDGDADNNDACLVGCVAASCGDGFVRTGVEDCDDANGVNTDACLVGCVAASCGDGFLHAGVESCDDGNLIDTDDCPGSCQPPVCGDGYVLAGVEPCDDGNAANDDDCLVGCILPVCGDGFVQNGVEACDDDNDDDTDACVGATCQLASCGDGFIFAGFEECDDGNATPGDGCTACQLDSAESSSDGGEASSEGSSSDGGTTEGGDTSEDTGGVDTSGGVTTDPDGTSGMMTTADPPGSSSEGGTDASAGSGIDPSADGSPGGCGCTTDGRGRGAWLAALVIGACVRRRRRR